MEPGTGGVSGKLEQKLCTGAVKEVIHFYPTQAKYKYEMSKAEKIDFAENAKEMGTLYFKRGLLKD